MPCCARRRAGRGQEDERGTCGRSRKCGEGRREGAEDEGRKPGTRPGKERREVPSRSRSEDLDGLELPILLPPHRHRRPAPPPAHPAHMRFKKSDDKNSQAGTSFTPSLDGATSSTVTNRPKTAPATNPSSGFPSLLRFTSDVPAVPESEPLITLKLSSPSFLESVVHDDLSANPLYVIETQDNTTKIRRTDNKGFLNVSRVRWRQNAKTSRRSRELVGIQVAFGKGPWKPAEEFLGYSYGSLLRFVPFLALPVQPHSLTDDALPAIASFIYLTIPTA